MQKSKGSAGPLSNPPPQKKNGGNIHDILTRAYLYVLMLFREEVLMYIIKGNTKQDKCKQSTNTFKE